MPHRMLITLLSLLPLWMQDESARQIAQTEAVFRPDPGWKSLGKDLWFDPEGKRLVLRARVCLRDGYLEHLLCSRDSKEHESILSTEAPARMIHAGLLLTGAEVGKSVQFVPDFSPPTGTPIRIEAAWVDAEGKERRIDARQWVREGETTKVLESNWVFAGSQLYPHPDTGEMLYAAEAGDLITVANFMSAILDVPIASTADDSARSYMAFTERIPPVGTAVTLYLSPISPPSKDQTNSNPSEAAPNELKPRPDHPLQSDQTNS